MNINSFRLIEEVILPSASWTSLEITQDIIYLDFSNVELGNPLVGDKLSLSMRFSDNVFIMFFYKNIWNIDFLADFDYNTIMIDKSFDFKVSNIKFQDFEYLDKVINEFPKNKVISLVRNFDIKNIRNDFFLIFEINNVCIVVGGNNLNFFTESEKLDDYMLKELSNKWMLYFLDYQRQRKILNKDSMCEIHLKKGLKRN